MHATNLYIKLATYTPYIIPVCFVVEEYVNGSVFPLLLEHEIELLAGTDRQIGKQIPDEMDNKI